MRLKLNLLLPAAALFVASLSASSALASTISIGLQEAGVNGGVVTTVATGSTSAIYNNTYGNFSTTITAVGTPSTLQTTSIDLSNSTAGTLYIYITEQGLTSPTGLTSFLSGFTTNNITGTPTITEVTGYSNTNQLYNGTELAQHTFTSGDQASSTNLATLSSLYSETVVYAITTTGASTSNNTINLTATSVTPEPSSLVLLGTGLIGAATTALRRRKVTA